MQSEFGDFALPADSINGPRNASRTQHQPENAATIRGCPIMRLSRRNSTLA